MTRWTRYAMVGVLVLAGASRALAQDGHLHGAAVPQKEQTADQKRRANDLVQAVKDATNPFQNPLAAEGALYFLSFGCVSGGDFGAMGIHFVNDALVKDGKIEVDKPEVILYEALPNGRLKLTGADYLVFADQWHEKNPGPPELGGQLFHLFDAPNRFGLPAFYTLHVWAWKENPNGTFANWNPNVSCDGFNGVSR